MAEVTPSAYGLAAAGTLIFNFEATDPGGDTIRLSDLLAEMVAGPLKSLCAANHADATALEDAWFAAGCRFILRQMSGGSPNTTMVQIFWLNSLLHPGEVDLKFIGADAGNTFQLQLQFPHSIIQ